MAGVVLVIEVAPGGPASRDGEVYQFLEPLPPADAHAPRGVSYWLIHERGEPSS